MYCFNSSMVMSWYDLLFNAFLNDLLYIALSSGYRISLKNIIITSSGQAPVLRPACSFQHHWLKLIELYE